MTESTYQQAAEIIREAEAFIVTAGAGMGVDSGLPDFRGERGFWKAYPAYAKRGLSFEECATPMHFISNPHFAWGFYGHRTNLYRDIVPHKGFQILKSWAVRNKADCFIVTSNVDGQFQKAGYAEEQVYEVHGSIHWLQCQSRCTSSIWSNEAQFIIDETTMHADDPLPQCPDCGKICRPNILMFDDSSWLQSRTHKQSINFDRFLKKHVHSRIAVIELGAGVAIPTIRQMSVTIGHSLKHATVIRINPCEAAIAAPHIPLLSGALSALQHIDTLL
jgi:NAD-dependent SIR2 family protein deacetylase